MLIAKVMWKLGPWQPVPCSWNKQVSSDKKCAASLVNHTFQHCTEINLFYCGGLDSIWWANRIPSQLLQMVTKNDNIRMRDPFSLASDG